MTPKPRNKNPKRTHRKRQSLELLKAHVSAETNEYICQQAVKRNASLGVALDEIAREHRDRNCNKPTTPSV